MSLDLKSRWNAEELNNSHRTKSARKNMCSPGELQLNNRCTSSFFDHIKDRMQCMLRINTRSLSYYALRFVHVCEELDHQELL